NLGFMNLQASELLKIGIILYIPYMIEKKRPRVFTQPKLLTSPIILAGFCIGLVFLQRDVGQTLLILIIFFAILFYAGIGVQKSIKYILTILVGAVI
ncbi:FtsW/RodA/SpoVE family cell cycle protein, partial [Klebsiella pneumoniae]|nr:FtsW/RodA/SpoVE family cell cycle protein [Klebsiella pneumoniae]